MILDIETGLLDGAEFIPSPNHDPRSDPMFVNALIIHAISLPPTIFGGEYVEDFFCNKLDPNQHPYFQEIADLQVSSHFYLKRDGALIQFVPTSEIAWHAGVSELAGLDKVNDFSIGVELEGCDEQPFTGKQYEVLADLSRALLTAYPAIHKTRIVGHCDIARGRKTDPGPCFDWERYKATLPPTDAR